jgi:HlyD family secretion protein
VSQSDADSAVNRRDLAQSDLASTQQQWDTLDRQQEAELEAARARVAQAKASLDAARAGAVQDELKRADVVSAQAQVARAQAAVINARSTLDYTTITAPRDGVILARYVEEGTIVTSGKSLVSQGADIVLLGDLSEMLVEVSMDESDVGMVKVGLQATITVDALPEEAFRGQISRIDPQATTQQNVTTVLVTVRVEKPDSRLRPGMTASCEFPIARAGNVLCVPSLAVQHLKGQHVLFVRQGKEAVPVPVEIGLVGDSLTEIRSGVGEGAEVVLPLAAVSAGSGEPAGPGGPGMGRRMGGAGAFLRQP